MPRFSGLILGLIVMIFYIAVFIPFILPHLIQMFNDWVNNSGNMFIQNVCIQRQILNQTSNQVSVISECNQQDFRPLIIFLFQLTVYFIIPTGLILYAVFKK
jgi:hypothetical protein